VESGEGIERPGACLGKTLAAGWNPVKELKVVDVLERLSVQVERWNPVKELKGEHINAVMSAALRMWNPVKELKDLPTQ